MPARSLHVLAAAALLLLLALGVWLAGRAAREAVGGEGVAAAAPEAAAAAPPATAPARGRSDLGPEVIDEGGLVLRVGVRLGGPGRLAGRVLERGTGRAVAGARVDLLALPPAGVEIVARIYRLARFTAGSVRRTEPVATQRSGADGTFAFEGVRRGRYFIEARGVLGVPDDLALVDVLASGAGGPVDVFVRPGGRIVGRVVLPSGEGAARVTVTCSPGPGTFLSRIRANEMRVLETTSGEDGAFALAGVPPGEDWELSAIGPGLSLSHRPGIEVVAGEDTVVELHARAGGVLAGVVLARDETTGALRPVGGAQLGAIPRGLRDLPYADEVLAATHAVSDAAGRYRLRRVPPGQVDVVAVAPGLRPASVPATVFEGLRGEVEDLVLSGGPVVELELVDAGGAPVSGVSSTWWMADWQAYDFQPTPAPFLLQAVHGFDFPVSDAAGRLVAGPFAGAPPYRLGLYHPAFVFRAVAWDPGRDGERLRVVLQRGGAVEGICIDVAAGEPVGTFSVSTSDRVQGLDEAPTSFNAFAGGLAFEDPQGRFRLDGLAPGTPRLVFTAPGYLPVEVADLPVVEGEVTRGCIVRFEAGGTVRGVVVDPDGSPVGGAQVHAVDARGRPVVPWSDSPRLGGNDLSARRNQELGLALLEAFSNLGVVGPGMVSSRADGSYELNALPPGALRVRAQHRDHAPGQSPELAVGVGTELEGVEVRLVGGAAVHGTVEDPHGRPVAGALVMCVRPERLGQLLTELRGDLGAYQDESDAEGRYEVAPLPAGSYVVVCVRGDEALLPASFLGTLNLDLIHVAAGERVRHDLVDTSVGTTRVFGRVTAGGRPVDRGGLAAMGFGTEGLLGVDVKLATVGRDGGYEFVGLAPGPYQLTYQSDGPGVRLDVEVLDQPEMRLDVELPAGTLAGRVVDAETGEGIATATVSLRRVDEPAPGPAWLALVEGALRRRLAPAERGGRFRFPRLAPATYVLSARDTGASGYAPAAPLEVELGPDEVRADLLLELVPGRVLRGEVRDGDGEPIPGAWVDVYPREGALEGALEARTDAGGGFEVRGLADGVHDVGAGAAGFADGPLTEVALGGSPPPLLVLELLRGVEVVLVVRGPDGAPVPGAAGRLVPLDRRARPGGASPRRSLAGLLGGEGVADAEGHLSVGRHLPGRYRVEVARGALRGELPELVVPEGPPLEVEVRLR